MIVNAYIRQVTPLLLSLLDAELSQKSRLAGTRRSDRDDERPAVYHGALIISVERSLPRKDFRRCLDHRVIHPTKY